MDELARRTARRSPHQLAQSTRVRPPSPLEAPRVHKVSQLCALPPIMPCPGSSRSHLYSSSSVLAVFSDTMVLECSRMMRIGTRGRRTHDDARRTFYPTFHWGRGALPLCWAPASNNFRSSTPSSVVIRRPLPLGFDPSSYPSDGWTRIATHASLSIASQRL